MRGAASKLATLPRRLSFQGAFTHLDHASLHPSLTDPGLNRAVGQFLRGTWPLKARLIREAMFKDGLHLLKSIFELPFPFD